MNHAQLPDWVWDLVSEVERFEEEHPTANDCLGDALNNIPAEVRTIASVIARREWRKIHDPKGERS